jgi:phosphoenolpyruvate-protein kinase (PTS system EI component)
MAGSAFYVPILIGLGARELSMNANSIQQVRRLISGITLKDAVDLVNKVRTFETAEEIEGHVRQYYIDHWNELFSQGLLNSRHR